MAYREFYKPIEFAVAESTFGDSVANMFQTIDANRRARSKDANAFEYDLSEGKFDNDQKILTEYANSVVGKGKDEIMKTGRSSSDTSRMMNDGKMYQQMSKNQFEEAKGLVERVNKRGVEDAFYNPQSDLQKIQEATHGKDNEVNFYTRGNRLKAAAQNLGGVDSFKYNDYLAFHVKRVGERSKEASSASTARDGASSKKSNYSQATFWNEESGKPGVTDGHAIDYLKSDPRVDQYFDAQMDKQLSSEIERMKNSGDPRVAWMKGGNAVNITGKSSSAQVPTEEEIKAELIKDPTKNIINSTAYGVRKRELAKRDLAKADQIASKTSVEYVAPQDKKNPDGTNENIAHGTTYISDTPTTPPVAGPTRPADDFWKGQATVTGPGGNIVLKKGTSPGKPITTDLSSSKAFNYNESKTVDRPNGKFNLTGYMATVYDGNGNVVPIAGKSTDEMIASINSIPNEKFATLAPSLKIGLKGYTIDETKLMGDLNKRSEKLAEQIALAKEEEDYQRAEDLTQEWNTLRSFQGSVGNSNLSDEDMATAATAMGVKQIRVNQLLQANQADLSKVKDLTGLDLQDESKWSSDMKRVQEAYRAKYNQAQGSGFKSAQPAPAKKTATKKEQTENKSIPTINSQEAYNKLPAGAKYYDSQGNLRTKKNA
jgi:hypothetical protein